MKKKVLTVDDSRTIRNMLLVTLNNAGFETIQAEDGIVIILGHLGQRLGPVGAGIVDEDIKGPEAVDDLRKTRRIRHIGDQGPGRETGGGQLCRRLLDLGPGPGAECDLCPRCRIGLSDGATDAATGPGDQRPLPIKPEGWRDDAHSAAVP